jgi:transposase
MQDRELYATILGIELPWRVERVELDAKAQRVIVFLEYQAAACSCPECGRECPLHDHRDRQWRHLDTCQYETLLQARVPRVECPEHGVHQVRVTWAEAGSRFTALFERLAIDWLREAPVLAVARRMRLSWDEAWGIQARAVKRGLERRKDVRPIFVGVDEKAFRRGHRYVTIVNDLVEAEVLFISLERTRESLEEFWREGLSERARAEVVAVAMDMWEPYVQATLAHLTGAEKKIVFDKFHVAKHLNEAVDKVRRGEHKELWAGGDQRLKGTKYWWLRPLGDLNAEAQRAFRSLRNSDLKVARAWAIKEMAMRLWEYRSKGWAERFFKRWYFWATHSRLKPIIKVARMLKGHLSNLLTYVNYPITNAASEAINGKIQAVKAKARGFRNSENFIAAIYFHCGGLDLYPH